VDTPFTRRNGRNGAKTAADVTGPPPNLGQSQHPKFNAHSKTAGGNPIRKQNRPCCSPAQLLGNNTTTTTYPKKYEEKNQSIQIAI